MQIKLSGFTTAMDTCEGSLIASLKQIMAVAQPRTKLKLRIEKWVNSVDDLMRSHPFRRFAPPNTFYYWLGTVFFIFALERKKVLGMRIGKLQRRIVAGVDVSYPTDAGEINLELLTAVGSNDCVVDFGEKSIDDFAKEELTKWAARWNAKLKFYPEHPETAVSDIRQ